jgi:hypothetical protein
MNTLARMLPEWPLAAKLALLALPMALNWWGIWHIQRHEFSGPAVKALWFCACVFLPVAGGVAYMLFGCRQVLKPDNSSLKVP